MKGDSTSLTSIVQVAQHKRSRPRTGIPVNKYDAFPTHHPCNQSPTNFSTQECLTFPKSSPHNHPPLPNPLTLPGNAPQSTPHAHPRPPPTPRPHLPICKPAKTYSRNNTRKPHPQLSPNPPAPPSPRPLPPPPPLPKSFYRTYLLSYTFSPVTTMSHHDTATSPHRYCSATFCASSSRSCATATATAARASSAIEYRKISHARGYIYR
jgi:hypothetical protein